MARVRYTDFNFVEFTYLHFRHSLYGKIICHVSFYEIVFAHQKFMANKQYA
jgi:hypothetical protein